FSRSPSCPRRCGWRSTPRAGRGGSGRRRRGSCSSGREMRGSQGLRAAEEGRYFTRVEKESDEEYERGERPEFMEEPGERGETRELAVRPVEDAQEFVDGAVGAEDLREESSREHQHDGEVDAREAREAAHGE